jgi:hypothetical protein
MPLDEWVGTPLWWDPVAEKLRWGPKAHNPGIVSVCERAIAGGHLELVWRNLAALPSDPHYCGLNAEEERYVVGKALHREAAAGRIDPNMASVLLRLLDPPDRLRTEAPRDYGPVIQAIQADPGISLGKITRQCGVSLPTARKIKRMVVGVNQSRD